MPSASNSGGGRRPRRQPTSLLPWLVPQPRPEPEEEESTRTHSPFLDFGNPPPPAKPKPEESTWSNSPYHDFGNPSPSPSRPLLPPPGGDQPSQSSHDYGDRPGSQSTGQGSSSGSGKQGDTGSDKSENETKSQKPASSQPSTPDFPPDIEWSPEDEPSGLIPFIQAAAQGTRDSSEDKTTAICEALYAADPEGVARGLKFITGCEPDEEQDIVQELTHVLKTIAPDGLFEDEPWFTTRLGPSEPFAASAAGEVPVADQAQVAIDAGNSDAPELNRRIQYSLTESDPGEWDASLTDKEDLEKVLLIPKLKRLIHGFDEDSVNWGDFTVQESIDFYLRQIAGELRAASENPAVSDEHFQELQAEYAWATELQALAKPIPLDDTTAYTEVFDVGAEGERTHVQNQLEVIYKYLDITPADDHLESQSTTELKYELYTLLIHNVLPLRENGDQEVVQQLYRSFTLAAGVSPQDAVDRLQGTYREPDVLGFLFVMGLTMLVEPLDWVITTVDVINALSERDFESAVGNFILGVVPFASSKMDDAFRLVGDLGGARWTDIDGKNFHPDMYKYMHDIDQGILTTFEIRMRNDLINRGYSEQVVEDMMSGAATRPDFGQGPGQLLGKPEPVNSRANTQNEVAEFLGSEGGYHVISLGPTHNNTLRTDWQNAISYRGTGDPDIVILHRNDDGTLVGREFDIYTPTSRQISRIFKSIKDKVRDPDTREYRQADRIVLNLEHVQNDINLDDLKDLLDNRNTYYLKEIIVVERIGENYGVKDVWTFKQ